MGEFTDAFKGLVKIAQIEQEKLSRNSKFQWLNDQGGLFPRHLDRLIYMIGSDNFLLNSEQSKRHAPDRRQLIKDALVSSLSQKGAGGLSAGFEHHFSPPTSAAQKPVPSKS